MLIEVKCCRKICSQIDRRWLFISKNYIDITGEQFGHLTVVGKYEGTDKKGIFWKCVCDCGNPNERIIKGTDLRADRVKSCGQCDRYKMIGQRFGYLTVVEFSEVKNKRSYFKCQCDCGNVTYVPISKLKSGHTRSCGCLQKKIVSLINKRYNDFDLSGDYGIGYTSKGDQFLFDKEDYDKIKNYCWYITSAGYVCSNGELLHRLVMDAKTGYDVDHINHNPLDCRKNNLRICTHQQNIFNSKTPSHNTSGYKGVHYDCVKQCWIACIEYKGSRYSKTGFKTPKDAYEYRLLLEEKYQKDFSYLKSMEMAGEN